MLQLLICLIGILKVELRKLYLKKKIEELFKSLTSSKSFLKMHIPLKKIIINILLKIITH